MIEKILAGGDECREDITPHPLDTINLRFIEMYGPPIKEIDGKIEINREALAKDRRFQQIMDFYEAPFYTALNYSDAAFLIHGKIYMDFCTKEVMRLMRVKQLGTTEINILTIGLTHTRFDHSLLVAALADSLLTSLGFMQGTINMAIAAGLLHDIAIPPFSEQGKLANVSELCEEENISFVIDRSTELQRVLKMYRIAKSDLIACVKGKYPVIGKLMNSKGIDLDRIAYLSRDVHKLMVDVGYNFIKYNISDDDAAWVREFGNFRERIQGILKTDPLLFNIYREIKFIDDEPVFENADRVYNFLLLRAVMYKNLYLNKFNMEKEAFLQRELERLWHKGVLNRQNMTSMGDDEFLEKIQPHIEPSLYHALFYSLADSPFVEIERHYGMTREQAEILSFEKCSLNDVVVKQHLEFDPGTNVKVLCRGKGMPFEKLEPGKAEEIKQIIQSMAYTAVYGLRPLSS